MEKITGTCPGCRKRCDLSTPRCPVGEAYAKSGKLPEGKKHRDRKEAAREALGAAAPDDRLAGQLRAVSRAVRHGEGTLDALSEEEKALLGALLDKAWAGIEAEDARGHRHRDGPKERKH